jgi:hypothetical protein
VSEKVIFYPNPTSDYIHLYVPGTDDTITVKLTNLSGQIIENTSKLISEGRMIELDLTAFPLGLYIVHLEGKTVNETIKVIKQ